MGITVSITVYTLYTNIWNKEKKEKNCQLVSCVAAVFWPQYFLLRNKNVSIMTHHYDEIHYREAINDL